MCNLISLKVVKWHFLKVILPFLPVLTTNNRLMHKNDDSNIRKVLNYRKIGFFNGPVDKIKGLI
jgi:hypothetical protein